MYKKTCYVQNYTIKREDFMRKEEKKKLKKLYLILAIMIFLIIFIDQLSKVLVVHYEEIALASGKIILRQSDILSNAYDETSRGVTIITNLVIVGIILGIIKSDNQFITKKTKILLSFAFAGGVSNIIDRLCRGNVVEFIHIGNFPAFNIADVCILIGWVSFVAIFASFSAKELFKKKSRTDEKKKTENNDNTNS